MMPDETQLRREAHELLRLASESFTMDGGLYVVVPANALDFLREALGPVDPETAEDWRFIWIDPGRYSGQPCIGGHRLPAEQMAGYVWEGETVEAVARQWDITVPQVLVACWFMGIYGSRTWKKRWGAWAGKAYGFLWDRDTQDQCPPPPRLGE